MADAPRTRITLRMRPCRTIRKPEIDFFSRNSYIICVDLVPIIKRAEQERINCYVCNFEFCIHWHHLKRRADHPALSKVEGNLLPLCKFCHRRVHSESPRRMEKLYQAQMDMIARIHAIAPSLMSNEYSINWSLIGYLRKIMRDPINQFAYCLECGVQIGHNNGSILKFLCDKCRDGG